MKEPKLIYDWSELQGLESETHYLDIDMRFGSGWITCKITPDNSPFYFDHNHYLSTHAFYGRCYEESTMLLQRCGFNVQLVSWGK